MCLCLGGFVFANLATGCSSGPEPKRVMAKGRLHYNGQPPKISPQASVSIGFFPIEDEGKLGRRISASYDHENKSFTVPGPDGHGIPPGKYRIAIMLILPDNVPELANVNETFGAANTQILRDIQTEEPISIDLSKPEG